MEPTLLSSALTTAGQLILHSDVMTSDHQLTLITLVLEVNNWQFCPAPPTDQFLCDPLMQWPGGMIWSGQRFSGLLIRMCTEYPSATRLIFAWKAKCSFSPCSSVDQQLTVWYWEQLWFPLCHVWPGPDTGPRPALTTPPAARCWWSECRHSGPAQHTQLTRGRQVGHISSRILRQSVAMQWIQIFERKWVVRDVREPKCGEPLGYLTQQNDGTKQRRI